MPFLGSLPLASTTYVEPVWILAIKSVVIFIVLMTLVPLVLILERKLLGRFQARYGPNRVGPFGLLQPIADIGKLLAKEHSRPVTAAGALMIVAPVVSVVTAVVTFAIIPFGDVTDILGYEVGLYGIDVNIGILYAFAFGAIGFYGLMLGGWASGSKYSYLGAMRSAAQLISYEVSLGLSLLGVVMLSQSLSLVDIVNSQDHIWYIVPEFVGFLIFVVAGFAETNRAPFDLPEADAELVQGYMTEYGGARFGSFFLAEYMNMLTISGIATTMFLGGWHGPWLPGVLWVLIKIMGFMVFFIWVRATLPRLRYDQLMSFGWKILLPLATLNALVTAIVVTVA